MTTATAINLDTLITKECKEAIDRILNSNMTSSNKWIMSNEDVKIASYGVINNIQLRDYLLGAPYSHSLSRSIEGIQIMIKRCEDMEIETYQLETILAQFLFERGEQANALMMLQSGMKAGYSLARLLTRVMISGATPAIFTAMRVELHPKVIENLISDANELANEANR